MPIDLQMLCRQISPESTVLLFGAGSSIPSGGVTGQQLAKQIAAHFKNEYDPTLTLSEIATIIENKVSRNELINFLRSHITQLVPTGSLINLPLYNWKSIFTTNYDTLIEQVYERKKREFTVYRSNYDFSKSETTTGTKIYKLHGSIEQDKIDGSNSRIIISLDDYDFAETYRQQLFKTLSISILSANLLIIGHSLSDLDLKTIIEEAITLKREEGCQGKIFLLLYNSDSDRALRLKYRKLYTHKYHF